jgi:hypothetical protein
MHIILSSLTDNGKGHKMNKTMTFEKNSKTDMEAMTIIIAGFTKEGIEFKIDSHPARITLTLTGGY